ncbi:peroxiredoxin family protein [Psychroserpens sp. NJDZ02]|uniref:peroxiredoxin family protein n=1 Tax=Psychroserpens sp. NJDZ02 TaxID=2570561 RepID=UPI0010A86DDD|nr:TlpA disulfide reductase family protein [Psychroserpens sp. NJDZ02]QCE42382.1 TlpA family protein disulfide reductase [Psychroserpens sp. NJDZ02]
MKPYILLFLVATLSLSCKQEPQTPLVFGTNIGDYAPTFTAKTPEGKDLSLGDIKAKVIILDFWASWCSPCRRENPTVVKMYNKYHSKGLEIIGVSLDKQGQASRWINAIAQDKLTWKHVSNLQGWQEPIAVAYGVHAIPATYILDGDGKVIAKNLREKALEDKVAEILDN